VTGDLPDIRVNIALQSSGGTSDTYIKDCRTRLNHFSGDGVWYSYCNHHDIGATCVEKNISSRCVGCCNSGIIATARKK
jgi:hypothetical protein